MPGFSTEVPHALGKDAAVEKLKGFLDQVKERYAQEVSEVDGSWNDNVLDFKVSTFGIKVAGKVTVEEDVIKMDGDLPFAAMMFKGKITESFRAAIEKAMTA